MYFSFLVKLVSPLLLKYEAVVAQLDSSHNLLGAGWSSPPPPPYQSPQNKVCMEEHLPIGLGLHQAGEEPRAEFISPDGQPNSFHSRCGETGALARTGTGP